MNNFKKLATASAVAATLGMVGAAQALSLGEPGEALLVPYVLCENPGGADQVNTLVGITVPGILGTDSVPSGRNFAAGGLAYGTAPTASGVGGVVPSNLTNPALMNDAIHWYFYSTTSAHVLDNGIPASADDFVPFDWCAMLNDAGYTAGYGQLGYLVIGTEIARTNIAATFAMYGDAAVIQGNWQSAGYVPVVPMADAGAVAIAANVDEVLYAAGIPNEVNPLTAGMGLDDDSGVAGDVNVTFDMRYFSDPALNGGTDLVVWFPDNCRAPVVPTDPCNRNAVPVEVYDTEETTGSAQLNLSLELNVIDATTVPWTAHTDNTTAFGEGLVNQGFIWVQLAELPAGMVDADDANAGPAGPDSAGVAFSLIRFGSAANAVQVQTALAHERGAW